MSYDPTIGRWLSEDPEGFRAADANLYRYVGNDPTNFIDPSGLIAQGGTIKDKEGKKSIGGWDVFPDKDENDPNRPGIYFFVTTHFDSVQQMAKAAGGDHFNLFQIVTYDDNAPSSGQTKMKLQVPYTDPPVGGYDKKTGDVWADNLPWYENDGPIPEKLPSNWDPDYHISATKQATKDTYKDYDYPVLGKKNGKVSFKTWLVLLDEKGNLIRFIGGVSWDLVTKDGKPTVENLKDLPDKEPTAEEYNKANENSGLPQRMEKAGGK